MFQPFFRGGGRGSQEPKETVWASLLLHIKTMSYQQQISIRTEGSGDMHDLSRQVALVVTSSGIQTGIVNIFKVGSTPAVGTIEFEPGIQNDLPAILDNLTPSRNYGHEQACHDGNGHSHLQATLLGPSLHSANCRWQTCPRYMAANLSPGVRCARAPRVCLLFRSGCTSHAGGLLRTSRTLRRRAYHSILR